MDRRDFLLLRVAGCVRSLVLPLRKVLQRFRVVLVLLRLNAPCRYFLQRAMPTPVAWG